MSILSVKKIYGRYSKTYGGIDNKNETIEAGETFIKLKISYPKKDELKTNEVKDHINDLLRRASFQGIHLKIDENYDVECSLIKGKLLYLQDLPRDVRIIFPQEILKEEFISPGVWKGELICSSACGRDSKRVAGKKEVVIKDCTDSYNDPHNHLTEIR